MLSVAWLAVAHAVPYHQPCGLSVVADTMPPVNRDWEAPHVPALPGNKGLRDPFAVPNAEVSDNFVIRWGNRAFVGIDDLDRLLQSFELAWEVQVNQMGHTQPYGTQAYRFNVYIGDSGDGAPPGYGTGGYYTVDPEGWPMVVISAATLADASFTEHASIHEFYHAIQGATERFVYAGSTAWYTEATAEWAAIETDPENPVNGPFIYAYGLFPDLPLNFFDYPDSGAIEEAYQYGAFVFPTHAAELAGWEVIRDTWTDTGPNPDPLEVLREKLADRGFDLDDVFVDHVARNATWDYEGGNLYASAIDSYGEWFGIDPVLAIHSSDGTGGPREVKGRAPRRYGYNAIELRKPYDGTLDVRVQGEAEGTKGSPARFGARVVVEHLDGAVEYHPVAFDEANLGTAQLEVVEDDLVWLMVGAWTPELVEDRWEDERFQYEYELLVTPPVAPDPYVDEERPVPGSTEIVCGCATGAGPSAAALLPLLLVGLRRCSSR